MNSPFTPIPEKVVRRTRRKRSSIFFNQNITEVENDYRNVVQLRLLHVYETLNTKNVLDKSKRQDKLHH